MLRKEDLLKIEETKSKEQLYKLLESSIDYIFEDEINRLDSQNKKKLDKAKENIVILEAKYKKYQDKLENSKDGLVDRIRYRTNIKKKNNVDSELGFLRYSFNNMEREDRVCSKIELIKEALDKNSVYQENEFNINKFVVKKTLDKYNDYFISYNSSFSQIVVNEMTDYNRIDIKRRNNKSSVTSP